MTAAKTTRHVTLPVTGMTCANCVSTIERNLRRLDGVEEASVSLASERASVVYDPSKLDPTRLVERVRRAGYDVALGDVDLSIQGLADDNDARRLEQSLRANPGVVEAQVNYAAERARLRYLPTLLTPADVRKAVEEQGFEAIELGAGGEGVERAARTRDITRQRRRLIVGLAFTIPLFALSMAADLGLLPVAWRHAALFGWVQWALATPVQFYSGGQYYSGAFKALRNGAANMDVLIAMGSSAAYFYSVAVVLGLASGHLYFETAAVIITLIVLGKLLEARARGRTSDAVRRLMRLRPETARVVRGGQELEIPVEEVRVGDVFVVKPGEKIPVDGRVLEGRSAIDEAMLTGESMPGEKGADDELIGGTLNGFGRLKAEAQRVGTDTTLAQIVRLVEQAQATKAPIQRPAGRGPAGFVHRQYHPGAGHDPRRGRAGYRLPVRHGPGDADSRDGRDRAGRRDGYPLQVRRGAGDGRPRHRRDPGQDRDDHSGAPRRRRDHAVQRSRRRGRVPAPGRRCRAWLRASAGRGGCGGGARTRDCRA